MLRSACSTACRLFCRYETSGSVPPADYIRLQSFMIARLKCALCDSLCGVPTTQVRHICASVWFLA